MLTLGWEMHSGSEENKISTDKLTINDDAVYNDLQNILDNRAIRTVFQPIVSLCDATTVGYEALSRGPEKSVLESPVELFRAAEKYGKVWEVEVLCRSMALERAKALASDKMLFINVDPKIINDSRFRKGITKEMLAQHQINEHNIVFEITERTSIGDYTNFRRVLDNYISQGYKIAIDDTGSGYSGLRMIAETRPQFMKIDLELVRNIDKDNLKQALMKTLCEFSLTTGIQIIAEGIETVDELNTLIDIGVKYGQGYLLHRPATDFTHVGKDVMTSIIARNQLKNSHTFQTPLTIPIGDIARQDKSFCQSVTGGEILDYFNANPNILGVTVVNKDEPVGLLMKNKFLAHLATQYGVAVYMNRPAGLLMNKAPLIVDYHIPLEQVSRFAVSRDEDNLYDYIIVTRNSKYFGITTVKQLLEKTTQLEINRAKHSNPLSGLPGNLIIEHKLKQIIDAEHNAAVLYIDLDNFKAYNDTYGFDSGDKIICLAAQTIQAQLKQINGDVFVGHIGGDDFIAVIPAINLDYICQSIIDNFDVRVREYYNQYDRERGYITAKNRHGIEEKFPFVAMSIAVVKTGGKNISRPAGLAEAASEIKKKCKLVWKSNYIIV